MDSVLTQQREEPSRSYTLDHSYKPISGSNDPYPRSFPPPPFDLNSPLPASFAIWPPTPRTAGGRPATIHESTFSTYPLSSFPATSGLPSSTGTSWDSLSAHAMTSSLTVPSQYETAGGDMDHKFLPPLPTYESLEDTWDKPRGNFSSLLSDDMGRDSNDYLDAHYQPMDRSISMGDADERGRSLTRASTNSSGDDMLHPGSSSDISYDDGNGFDGSSMMSDYTRRTTPMSMNTNAPLSPVISSPCGSSRMSVRAASRKASPSPRPRSRIAPYTNESNRNKRWSTGSYFSGNNFSVMPSVDTFGLQPNHIASHHSSPICGPQPHSHALPFQPQNHYLLSHNQPYLAPTGYLPSSFMEPIDQHGHHGPMMNHGIMRMLQSNADPHHGHFGDLSEPPDLYASLRENQVPPPPEDMNPEDPEAKPHEQPGRFEGDLYTPRWVRYHGNRREGWCGICKPGRWLVLKNSAFWYDKSFTHGISAATGQQFVEPSEVRRMDGNPDVWEGLCHSCNDWVPLVSNKKKGTAWFRHAYKCHTHPKVKDAPKRRRESSQGRPPIASTDKEDSSSSHTQASSLPPPPPPPTKALPPLPTQQEREPLPAINRGFSVADENPMMVKGEKGDVNGSGGGGYYEVNGLGGLGGYHHHQ